MKEEGISMKNNNSHFRGCLLGGAIGDALGYTVEFMGIEQIKRRFGIDGITDLLCDKTSGKAIISDDTQMTIFTADGILWADMRGRERGICSYPACVFYSYQRWLYTQTGRLANKEYHWLLDNKSVDYKSELLNIKELFVRRAPGNTCLSALSGSMNQQYGTMENRINNSKGCGGVMRVAPSGLYFHKSPEVAFKIAAECAAITHGHPSGYLSAGVLACIIAEIINGNDVKQAAINAANILKTYAEHKECLDILQRAMNLSIKDVVPSEAVRQLGEGWVGEEALAIALYCALKYQNDFKKAIFLAVNHSGDSDSTGAICGNIVGAYLGIDGISTNWIENVELSELIISMADKLLEATT
ncbi:MAG: putative ADP-ribosylglycohydrolase [Firmicutes bacterium]|nr:putative ADP-ribosylglycohydrolase [Bacillota bacterium]